MGIGVGKVSGNLTNAGSKEAGGRRKDRDRQKTEIQGQDPPRTGH